MAREKRSQRNQSPPIPGNGTPSDLASLSSSLGMPIEDVRAMMNARGAGIQRSSRRSTTSDSDPKAAAAQPSSTAWSDFLQEEDESRTQTTASGSVEKEAGSAGQHDDECDDDDVPYELPLKASSTKAGVLVQTGTLDCSLIGRSNMSKKSCVGGGSNDVDLTEFSVLCYDSIFLSSKVKLIATSSSSCHTIAIDESGVPYVWGRNESRQLGFELPKNVIVPRKVSSGPWKTHPIVAAAVGKHHSVMLDRQGVVWSCGGNKCGQCGVNSSQEIVSSSRKGVVQLDGKKRKRNDADSDATAVDVQFVQVSCGEAFTCLLDTRGHLFTTGSSEFGQIGNGATGEHFVTASKIAFANSLLFQRRMTFLQPQTMNLSIGSEEKTTQIQQEICLSYISCGKNHTVAIEAPRGPNQLKRVFSWGCGDYGSLGHGVQSDSYFPRLLSFFCNPIFKANKVVSASCGAHCSLFLTQQGHVYYVGKHRQTGESAMCPIMVDALASNGHVVTCCAAGNQTVFCCTSMGVTVSWGEGQYGELGYGKAQKSSSKPKFVLSVDKCMVESVSCGFGHTVMLIRDDDEEDKEAMKKLARVEKYDLEGFEAALQQTVAMKEVAVAGKQKKPKGKKK